MAAAGLVIGAAIAAKIISTGWLASIATSPFDVGTRKRFIEHTEEAIANPHLKDLGYTDEDLAKVKADLEILRENVQAGWHDGTFNVAVNVATFKTVARTYGAVSGTVKLADYNLNRLGDWVAETGKAGLDSVSQLGDQIYDAGNRAIDAIFGPPKSSDPPDPPTPPA